MKNKKGFTLIELLIVIAIIGILSAALLPTIIGGPARGRDAARLGNLNSTVAALEAYNSDMGSYPQSAGCIGSGDVFDDDPSATVGNPVLNLYFAGGIPPADPSGSRTLTDDPGGCIGNARYYYQYVGTVGVAEYVIATVMELGQNNNSDTDPSTDLSGGITLTGDTYYILIK